MQFVTVRKVTKNGTEQTKRISTESWDLMRNHLEKGDTRKGWTLVSGPPAPKAGAAVGKSGVPSKPAFEPDEIKEATPAKETAPAASPAEAKPAQAEEAKEAAPDNFMLLQSFSPKAGEAMKSIGISTFAQLAAGDAEAMKNALVKQGIGTKAALIPGWKAKAAELAAK